MVTAKQVINSTKPKITKVPQGPTKLGSAGYDNIRDDIERTKSLREIDSESYSINMTAGENLSKGHVIMQSRTADRTAIKAGTTDGTNGRNMPIGIVKHDVLSGKSVLIIVAGVADVLSDGNVTHGDWLGCSDTNAGQVIASAEPAVPATANHFREIGHALTSRTGAGLFKAILHFN